MMNPARSVTAPPNKRFVRTARRAAEQAKRWVARRLALLASSLLLFGCVSPSPVEQELVGDWEWSESYPSKGYETSGQLLLRSSRTYVLGSESGFSGTQISSDSFGPRVGWFVDDGALCLTGSRSAWRRRVRDETASCSWTIAQSSEGDALLEFVDPVVGERITLSRNYR